jgi:hypothetical protein
VRLFTPRQASSFSSPLLARWFRVPQNPGRIREVVIGAAVPRPDAIDWDGAYLEGQKLPSLLSFTRIEKTA